MSHQSNTTLFMNDFKIFSDFKLAIISVSHDTSDFKGKWVGRIFDIRPGVALPTPFAVVKDSYEELLALKPPQCTIIPRSPSDAPVIRESWL